MTFFEHTGGELVEMNASTQFCHLEFEPSGYSMLNTLDRARAKKDKAAHYTRSVTFDEKYLACPVALRRMRIHQFVRYFECTSKRLQGADDNEEKVHFEHPGARKKHV